MRSRPTSFAVAIAAVLVVPLVALAATAPPPTAGKPAASASASSAKGGASASVAPSASGAPSAAAASSSDASSISVDDTTTPITTTPSASSSADAPPPGDSKNASWHPNYGVEVQPHFVVAGLDKFGPGLGLGIDVAVPVLKHAPITSIDDDISIGVGVDLVRYAAYKPRDPIGDSIRVSAVYIPAFVQWNFWLGSRVSIFLQPEVIFRFASYIDQCSIKQCVSTERILPSASVGMRFRIVNRVSFTLVVGWPMVALGGSWL